MNTFVRAAIRSTSLKALSMPLPLQQRSSVQNAGFTRSMWHMSKTPSTIKYIEKDSMGCKCGCGARFAHTEGEKELVNFLQEEVEVEKKYQSKVTLPSQIDEFQVKFDGAEVELLKQTANETVSVKFNVNHTVDADEPEEFSEDKNQEKERAENEEDDNIKSKPNFEVDIVRNGTTLSFTCTFLNGVPAEDEYDDAFGIEELTIYKGEFGGDKVYACSGDVLDGYLYDLMMNFLEERGITNEFSSKLVKLSTDYERSQYIIFLESLKKFVTGN